MSPLQILLTQPIRTKQCVKSTDLEFTSWSNNRITRISDNLDQVHCVHAMHALLIYRVWVAFIPWICRTNSQKIRPLLEKSIISRDLTGQSLVTQSHWATPLYCFLIFEVHYLCEYSAKRLQTLTKWGSKSILCRCSKCSDVKL